MKPKLFVKFLLQFSGKDKSDGYKLVSLMLGSMFFLVILPSVFIIIGLLLRDYIPFRLNRSVELLIAVVGIITGLSFLLWSTLTQWRVGRGVPVPNAPTQSLVVTGPYKLCRNPIELGAINYYLGIGIIFGGMTVGIIAFLLGLTVGSAYHKIIEEKELEARFGEEYKRYKEATPFLFPRVKIGGKPA